MRLTHLHDWPTCSATRIARIEGTRSGHHVGREHDCGAPAERIGRGAIVTRDGRTRWHLLVEDDHHHQQFIRPTSTAAGHAPTAAPTTP
jgi:hypothetical protein